MSVVLYEDMRRAAKKMPGYKEYKYNDWSAWDYSDGDFCTLNLANESCCLCEHGGKSLVKGGVCAGCIGSGRKNFKPNGKINE